jgi:hypothetical protein
VWTVGSSGDQRLPAIFFLRPRGGRAKTLTGAGKDGSSPRGYLRPGRGDEEVWRVVASSAVGDTGRLGSRKVICMFAEEKLDTELQRVAVPAFLGHEEGRVR